MKSKTQVLRHILVEYFNQDELRTLCHDLDIDYDDLAGEGKTAKSRELLALLERYGRLEALITYLEENRPNLQAELQAIKTLPLDVWEWRTAVLPFRPLAIILGLVAFFTILFLFLRPSREETPTATVIADPVATETAVSTSTITPTPVFVTEFVYDLSNPDLGVTQTELRVEPDVLPTDTITDFLQVTHVAIGTLDDQLGFNIRLEIYNTTDEPMVLDLNGRFFSLEDDQGRAATLKYFCCTAQGTILPAGQKREVQLMFEAVPGWFSKEQGVSTVFLQVQGFRPLISTIWAIGLPVTAE